MLQINNRKCIRRLSSRSLKNSRVRNWIAIIAIMLTATMFTSVFSIGMGIVESFQISTMRQVGTSAHGGLKFLNWQQYEKAAKDPEIKEISYNILIGFGTSPELQKTYTEIRYTEEKSAEWGFTAPTTGRLPEETMEIATSTDVLDALGVSHRLGETVPLEFTVNGVRHKENFTLCGFWEQDPVAVANEAFLSREYCDRVAPVWQEGEVHKEELGDDAGSVHPSFFFESSWDIETQMEQLKERCGFGPEIRDGVNWAYLSSGVDGTTILLVTGLLLLIMMSGYLIIYNVFYISVNSDIRFYGLLKTIGTTGKQLKKIVRKQALLLSFAGIPAGLFLGYLVSLVLLPVISKNLSIEENLTFSVSPVIFVGGGLFSFMTVWISCIKPCRLVAGISPVEAVRYTEKITSRKKEKRTGKVTLFSMAWENLGRMPKKTVSVVLSISLSLILLNSTATMINGFDMDQYLKNSVISDFYMTDASIANVGTLQEVYNGVSRELQQEIKAFPEVTETGCVYMQEYAHTPDDTLKKNLPAIQKEFPEALAFYGFTEDLVSTVERNGKISSHLYGVDGLILPKLEIAEGTFDEEKFQTGNYVIVSTFETAGRGAYYHVGDQVTIDYGNGKAKTYEVMALGNIPYCMSPEHGHGLDVYFTMPSRELIDQTGETGAMKFGFNVKADSVEKMEQWVSDYCEKVNPSMDYRSKGTYVKEFQESVQRYLMMGGSLSFIIALIGLLNFTNAMITSIQSRKKELATLQSVGMTGKQLRQMLVSEGICYLLITAAFVLTIGNLITYGIVYAVAHQIWFFSYHFVIWPVIVSLLIFSIPAAFIPALCYRNMIRKSLVERLRGDE